MSTGSIIALVVGAVIVIAVLVIIGIKATSGSGSSYRPSHPHITSQDRVGIQGERTTLSFLRHIVDEDDQLLSNLLLPLKNGHKTEVDCILISRRGLFCIEVKNWVGTIIGNDEDEYWIQQYDDPYKKDKKHKNPVKQNEGHCAVLERLLNNKYPVDNIVIFVDLETDRGIDSQYAFSIPQFNNYYRRLNDDELTQDEIDDIYRQIVRYVATPEELRAHREDIKNRYN